MAATITPPSSIGSTGISVRTEINSVNATPVSPAGVPITSSSVFITPPKGPDGIDLILNQSGTAWIPQSNESIYSDALINAVTDNGTNTAEVLRNGLTNTVNNFLNIQTEDPLASLNPPQLITPSDSVPGVFTADTKLIGQQLWQYKVNLYNHQQYYTIPTRAIKMLCIEDDLLSWPLRGYVIVDSRMEGFERSLDFSMSYYLRSDARDEIHVEVQPIIEKGTLPDKIWKIDIDAVIYDVEDITHENMERKAKKLYFWDKKFQNVLEKNIQWSTATGKRYPQSGNKPCPAPIAHASDLQRSMYTGEAIASLLYESGYEQYIDFDKWNWGKSKILFTAKADWSIWDCIQYILEQQISNDGKYDICILQWNRGDKKWNLTPVWKLFESAGISTPKELQIEHMFFEEPIAETPSSMSPPKAPLDLTPSYEKDIKSDDFNKIRNYRFSQTSGLDNSKAFVTHPIYSHWHKKKQFDVDVKENERRGIVQPRSQESQNINPVNSQPAQQQ